MKTKFITENNELYLEIEGKKRKVLRAWESFSGWYWFMTEKQGKDIGFGFVQGVEQEWGSFSITELESMSTTVWELSKEAILYSGRR